MTADAARAPNLEVIRLGNWEEYQAHAREGAAERARRLDVERELASPEAHFTVAGWCHVCAAPRAFEVGWEFSYPVDGISSPNWREHLRCPGCALNNRMRATLHLFDQECRVGPDAAVYLTEGRSPFHAALAARVPNLLGSEWLGSGIERGAQDSAGVRNEDLTRLTFESERFDAIVCLDVLEHVSDYLLAFAELRRSLRAGGALLFSVPFTDRPANTRRAELLTDGSVRHLLPPEFHGDPLNPAGCLCFHHFGWALLDELRALGFRDVRSLRYWSREFCYLGEGEQKIFFARRPSDAARRAGPS